MHELDFLHEHDTERDREQVARFIWSQDNIELRTIGIDIGSSTSHLLFAKVALQRQAQGLSSRFLVVGREIIWRSPIMLTPFLPDGTIDTKKLELFIAEAYRDAGLKRDDIDSGAVILTGEAIKKTNARAIDELFAAEAGKFVCATAGHKLECTLAAHGSGAVALSRRQGRCVLHVDIGGGTTKLALIDNGEILDVSAFAVGGRLIASDSNGMWTRVDETAQLAARELGFLPGPASFADPAKREAVAERLASVIVDQIVGEPLDEFGAAIQLTELLRRRVAPTLITFSGGVAEYIFGNESAEYGDIAKRLANNIVHQLAHRCQIPVMDPGHRIRATVIGASQFTVQVSGKTIFLPVPEVLPVRNIPVVHVGHDFSHGPDSHEISRIIASKIDSADLSSDARLAIAFGWRGDPDYGRLRIVGEAIVAALAKGRTSDDLCFLMIDGDVGATFGKLLKYELEFPGQLVAIDGVQLRDFDFVDVGAMISPPGVLPLVIKSLLFS